MNNLQKDFSAEMRDVFDERYMKRLNYLLDLPSVISADEAEKLQKEVAALKSEAGINDFRRLLLRMNCVIKKTLPMIGGVFVLIRRKGLF